tara:strand:- start:628 stop:870 length:243 start_codon:yes stop_codon:yes gene_type:complete
MEDWGQKAVCSREDYIHNARMIHPDKTKARGWQRTLCEEAFKELSVIIRVKDGCENYLKRGGDNTLCGAPKLSISMMHLK